MPLTNYLSMLQAALAHARRAKQWVVVVTPTDGELGSDLAKLLVCSAPPDTKHCGRTALLPGGGRVTVISGSQFLHGDGFHVMFVGFDDQLVPADEIAMHAWRQAAEGFVTVGAMPGEVRVH